MDPNIEGSGIFGAGEVRQKRLTILGQEIRISLALDLDTAYRVSSSIAALRLRGVSVSESRCHARSPPSCIHAKRRG